MGSSSSSPIGAQTHDQALKGTEYTRMIMDELLNYMIKQLSVRDLLHMSKESECKKYVLFKANAIYQYFHELRVFPTKDAKGLLTFRRVEDLVNPKGEQEKERQSLCLVIAYFYTRIFQIYGALALTLIDDVNAMTSSGLMTTFKKGDNMRLQTPGYYAQTPYYGRGGATLSSNPPLPEKFKLQYFQWIRSFLTSDEASNTISSIGYKTRYNGSGDDAGNIHIKIDEVVRNKPNPQGSVIASGNTPFRIYQYAKCLIRIQEIKEYYNTLIFYTLHSGDINQVTIRGLTFRNSAKEEITIHRFDRTFSIGKIDKNGKSIFVVKDSKMDVSDYMVDLLSKIIIYIRSVMNRSKADILDDDVRQPDTTENDTNEHEYSGYQSTRGTRGYQSNRTRSNRGYHNNRGTISRKSEEGITSHLRVEKMISALTTHRPLGHCISRALQLLKTEPFVNQAGISQICRLAFDTKGTERIGLPKRDEKLSEHPGLFALANLFYDTIIIGSPNLIIGKNTVNGHSSFEDYVAFMKTLSEQYESDPLNSQKIEEKGLSGIINKRDGKDCTKADDIPLTPEITTKVHEIVKSMFQKQVRHSENCYRIINMLFTITINPTTKKPTMFKLNDNLIREGFPELERINREARNILVEYYTDCENKYKAGRDIILEDRNKKAKVIQEAKTKAEANAKAIKQKQLDEQMRISAAELAKEKEITARVDEAYAKEEAAKKAAAPQRIATPLERQIKEKKLELYTQKLERMKQKEKLAQPKEELEKEQQEKTARKKVEEEAARKRKQEIKAKLIAEMKAPINPLAGK